MNRRSRQACGSGEENSKDTKDLKDSKDKTETEVDSSLKSLLSLRSFVSLLRLFLPCRLPPPYTSAACNRSFSSWAATRLA